MSDRNREPAYSKTLAKRISTQTRKLEMINFFKMWRTKTAANQPEAAALRFRVASDVKASQHPDGLVLIHVGKGTVFSANRAGAMIWNGAAEHQSLDKVAESISGAFNIPEPTARRDAAEFMAQLASEGLLIPD